MSLVKDLEFPYLYFGMFESWSGTLTILNSLNAFVNLARFVLLHITYLKTACAKIESAA